MELRNSKRAQPQVSVTCDRCGKKIVVQYVNAQSVKDLRDQADGWRRTDEQGNLCSSCVEQVKEAKKLGKYQPRNGTEVCSFCGKDEAYAHGLCKTCYARYRRNGTPAYMPKSSERDPDYWDKVRPDAKRCSYCHEGIVYARGYCRNCYGRLLRTGSPEKKGRKKAEKLATAKASGKNWQDKLAKKMGMELASNDERVQFTADVYGAMPMLSARLADVMTKHFIEGKTYTTIGEEYGITRARVQQLGEGSIEALKNVIKQKKSAEIEAKIKEEHAAKKAACEARRYKELVVLQSALVQDGLFGSPVINTNKLKESATSDVIVATLEKIRTEDMKLSVRLTNCLRHAGCETAMDVVQMSQRDLAKVRNCGEKTLKEFSTEIWTKLVGSYIDAPV